MIIEKTQGAFFTETSDTNLYKHIDAWITPYIDVCCIISLINYKKPKTFLEVGICRGHTSKILATKFPDMFITGVDPGDQVSQEDIPPSQRNEYLPQYQIGELVKDLSNVTVIKQEFRKINWTQKFDCIFIDGNHQYEEVLLDTKLALQLLNDNGIIIWHDYNNVSHVNDVLKKLSAHYRIIGINNTWIAYLDTVSNQ